MRIFLIFCGMMLAAVPALAQQAQVDLILPPQLATPDAPFYRGAEIKVGDERLPVVEAALPAGTLAQYVPETNAVVVSNDANISENRKGQALMDVMATLETAAIATAAGTEE